MRHIIIILTSIMLINCNSYKYGADTEPTEKSNLTFGVVKSKIIKNQTTQEEILKLFGSPNLTTKNKSNKEVWSYNKMSVVEKSGGSEFIAGGKSSRSSSTQSFDLIITFNEDDTVNDYSVVSTKF